jgi:uncharacterized protein YraI
MFTLKSAGKIKRWLGKWRRSGIAIMILLLSLSGVWSESPLLAQVSQQTMPNRNLFIPLIQDDHSSATPVATVAVGAKVYGLVGTLSQPTGKVYSYYLTTSDIGYYALAGETPALDEQIAKLATGTAPTVKVWGNVMPPEAASEPPLIVVTGILGTSVPTAPPVAGTSAPVAVVKFNMVNLYSGPGSTYSVLGQVVERQACEVTGRNQASSWLQLTCEDGQQGWVDARLVEVNGSVAGVTVINVATPTPLPTVVVSTATPTPTPVPILGWRMDVYNNLSLSGTPVATTDVPSINFNWGSGGPVPGIVDNFSVRFTRRISVPSPGNYQFTATADDGIRMWIDGQLIINAWPANPSQSYIANRILTGSHDIEVDYYEQGGLANVSLAYGPTPAESPWQASYFFGTTPGNNLAFSQQEPRGASPLDYQWGSGGPQPNAPGATSPGNDYWSARWVGDFPFDNGNYVFRANVDDGIRVYLDGLLVIGAWYDGYKEVNNRVLAIGSGRHNIQVDYYERTGDASIRLWWYRESPYVGPQ